ncbi:acyl carrier protein [uncultured Draconibacterium sp.]|uniref:acyl carrier protein n=1 Tax=uncultured Draconibacterium sp. TaxID=1573823 RepID=UPI0029C94196|nr:acyl carrier protein [uncultured Draconibacterium sp.]
MEKTKIKSEVKQILINILQHERFDMRDDLTASDVDGWDSLNHMNIITEIEETFSIRFKLRELNKLKNMGTLIELIQTKLN